ncbi:MAG: CPBP family intramembrane metalloprotease [Prevotella sp.]|nr:CPBP family intramembrane metalloprotease [Prevotella sp.]
MKRLTVAIAIAFVLWFVMFSQWTAPHLNFWYAMTVSACVLIYLSTYEVRRMPRFSYIEVLLGVCIAVVLWGVFWIGDKLSQLMFDFARNQVDGIYSMKDGTQPWLIGLLLLFIIGPAEELFWRGYVQRKLSVRWNPNVGFLVTTLIYTAVHIPSMNFMLIMAALTCGFCWGLLYRFIPQHFPAIVISHAVWDAAAFVWFPF